MIAGIPENRAHLLAAFLRGHWLRTGRPYRISDRSDGRFPSDLPELPIPEKLDRSLLYVSERSSALGDTVPVRLDHDWPLVQAHHSQELKRLLDQLVEEKALDSANPCGNLKGQPWGYSVTAEGWKRVAALRPIGGKQGRRAFVAMWLDSSLDGAYENGIRPALEHCNLVAWRADKESYQEKICDRIIVEIRRSRIVVADCTGHRANVYYEAGFAMGLEIPVIWSCRESDFDRLQFDTRQYTHIKWSSVDDLRAQLDNRIRALRLEPR